MNRWTGSLALVLLFGCTVAERPPAPPEISPEETLQAWTEAVRSADVEALLAFYEDSDDVLVIFSGGLESRGLPAIRKDYEEAFAEVEFEDASLTLSGSWQTADVAWAMGRVLATLRSRADDSRHVLEVNSSFVLRNQGETWAIAFEQSTPLEGVPRLRPKEDG